MMDILSPYYHLAPLSSFATLEISDGNVSALYHFSDEVDSSGNANTLTNVGSITFSTTSILSTGAVLNGTDQYFYTDAPVSTQTDNWGFAGWVYVSDTTVADTVFHNGPLDQSPSDTGYSLGIGDGSFDGVSEGNNAIGLANGVAWKDFAQSLGGTGWKHLVMQRSSGTWYLYVNGTESATTFSGAPSAPTENTLIGTLGTVTPALLGATIDEFVFIDRPFTSDEIAALYNSGSGNEVCVTVGCASTSTPTSTASSSDLNASDRLLTYLFYVSDGIWFFCVFVVLFGVLSYVFVTRHGSHN